MLFFRYFFAILIFIHVEKCIRYNREILNEILSIYKYIFTIFIIHIIRIVHTLIVHNNYYNLCNLY